MFHVEHFSAKGPLRVETSSARKLLCLWRIADGSRRPRCSTWDILSVADIPRGTFFRQSPPVGPSAASEQREKAWAVPTDSGWLSNARCSTWNILSVADVPRGTFSSFADVPRGNTFRQRPPTVRLSLPLRQREKAWAVPNGLAALEDPDVPRGTF